MGVIVASTAPLGAEAGKMLDVTSTSPPALDQASHGRPVLGEVVAGPAVGLPTPFAEAVLDLVERIPPGRVMSYGDVAAALGSGGARAVGTVMARFGSGVSWHRVIRSDGSPPTGHEREALSRHRRESTPLTASGSRVDMVAARWWPEES